MRNYATKISLLPELAPKPKYWVKYRQILQITGAGTNVISVKCRLFYTRTNAVAFINSLFPWDFIEESSPSVD